MPDDKDRRATEGNAAAALKAMCGEAPKFENINESRARAWDNGGNADAALAAWGQSVEAGESSSIQAEGDAKMPTIREAPAPYDLDKASA